MKSSVLKSIGGAAAITCLWLLLGYLWLDDSRWFFKSDHYRLSNRCEIPPNIDIADPEKVETYEEEISETQQNFDAHTRQLYRAGRDPQSNRSTVWCDITALDRLARERPEFLLRYLASHPGWAVCYNLGDAGPRMACRRMLTNRNYPEVGWRACFDSGSDEKADDEIKVHCAICLDKEDFGGQRCRTGTRITPEFVLMEDHCGNSEVICDGDNISLHVSERTSFVTSRVTQVVFDLADAEFLNLAKARDWSDMKKLLPSGSVRRDAGTICLWKSSPLDGEYRYHAWVNPGEAGKTYLRAFEVSRGIELGVGPDAPRGLKKETLEFAGWSDDPSETFYIGAKFSLREGKRDGSSFAARLEVWFIPASGGPERKLAERVFKVKGQER